jgi:VanZ family protein
VLLSFFRAGGWTCVAIIVALSLVPANERPYTGFPGQIDHIIAYCGAAGLLGLGYPTAKTRFGIVTMLALLAAALEVAQLWVPGRHSQFIDFAASTAGACVGMLAAGVVERLAVTYASRSGCK